MTHDEALFNLELDVPGLTELCGQRVAVGQPVLRAEARQRAARMN